MCSVVASARTMSTRPPHPNPESAEASTAAPRWSALAGAMAAGALLSALVASPGTALYWYIFPLFGLGGCYLAQFRSEFPTRWKVTFAASAVVSAVALALDWPFSGHVLWNVLVIGHAWTTGKRRTAWMALMLASLLYLFALKVAFQTGRDVAGAGISVALAAIVLLALADRRKANSK